MGCFVLLLPQMMPRPLLSVNESVDALEKDPSRLRQIEGTFRNPAAESFIRILIALFFGVVMPLVALYCMKVTYDSEPRDWGEMRGWSVLLLIFLCVGRYVWKTLDQRWVFTGHDVTYFRGGKVNWRVEVDAITGIRPIYDRDAYFLSYILVAGDKEYHVPRLSGFVEKVQEAASGPS